MNRVFRTFLNLLVAVSLAVAPISASIAALQTTAEESGSSLNMAPCHESMQTQTLTDTQQPVTTKAAEDCCDGDCCCPDNAGCHTLSVLTVVAIPAGFAAFPPVLPGAFATVLQATFNSLSPDPDSPPPIL